MFLAELCEQVFCPFDGPGHQLWEEGDEEGEDARVALGPDAAVVDVDGVAHGLEGVEGDAHGQQQPEGGGGVVQAQQAGQVTGGRAEEVQVLEGEEDAQVGDEAEPEPGLAPVPLLVGVAAHHAAAGVVDEGGEGQQQGVVHAPAHVEGVAGRQQQGPAEAVGQQVVEQHHGREEDQELEGVEQHGAAAG
ncbi:hypothetical protein [Pontibacter beigongshangensis]|uniref:hypothetical protein n=1 Tax=Pontibacter beigongshangensis TaxID=2574733 RepID=UPI001F506213|nr:hypothetical protein [Pontibacter beigongshangensis]